MIQHLLLSTGLKHRQLCKYDPNYVNSAGPYIFHVSPSPSNLRIIIYVFAIVFTDVSTEYISNFEISDADTAFLKLRFADLERSMQTLFQSISNGLTWGDVADKMHNLSWVWGYLFVVYVTWMVRCDTEYVVGLVDCSFGQCQEI